MKISIILFIVISFFAFNFNLNANTITISTSTNWSSIISGSGTGGQPNSSDAISVIFGATLIINVANGSCASVQLGSLFLGAGTLAFNSNSQLTVSGALTLGAFLGSSGTINMTSGGILKIGGSFTAPTIGTFTPGIGTIEYNGASGQTVLSFSALGNQAYNNLTINNSAGSSLGGAITINGAYTPTAGSLRLAGQTLTLAGTIGTIVTGTLTGSNTSSLIINGSGNMTLPSISGGLSSLTLNRGNNSIITLSSNVTVYNTLTFSTTSGNITTGANTLTLGDATTGMGTFTDNAGATTGVITGKFARYFTTTINSSPILFPVGDVSANSSPRTASIKFTTAPSTAGILTAQYISGDAGNGNTGPLTDSGPYTVDTYSHAGYWQIDAGTLAGGNYTILISPVGFTGMSVYANLRVLKRPSSGGVWTLQGIQVPGTSAPTASRSTLSGFSQFALGGNTIDNPLDGPLPVELTTFSANIIGRDVNLNWITASEQNNSGFEIQKQYSVSGSPYSDWAKIAFVNGNGTKTTPTDYTYEDKNLNTGKYKYRLIQIDYNGNFEYFNLNNEIVIGTPNKFDISQNYPNPFNPITKIDYQIPENGKVKLIIYDMLGREIKNLVNESKQSGYYSAEFDASSFSSGIYIYRLSFVGVNNTFLITKKMTLIK